MARPGIESRTSDLRVRCPTDCTTWPGLKWVDYAPLVKLLFEMVQSFVLNWIIFLTITDFGIRANSVHPGVVDTEIWTPMKRVAPLWFYKAYRFVLRYIQSYFNGSNTFGTIKYV